MNTPTLNPTQLYLLKMFSYAKTEKDLETLQQALTEFYAKRVDDAMDKLWEEGKWDNEKNEAILKEHLRTPYRD